MSGQSSKDTHIDIISNIIERLKRLIRNNNSYTNSDGLTLEQAMEIVSQRKNK